jgi:hypothetical protein
LMLKTGIPQTPVSNETFPPTPPSIPIPPKEPLKFPESTK